MTFIDLAIRSSALLAAGLLLEVTLRSSAAALRHFVLAAAVCAALVVVPLSFMLPAWQIAPAAAPSSSAPGQRPLVSPGPAALSGPSRPASPAAPQRPVAAVVWLAGFVVAGSELLIAIFRLAKTTRRGRRSVDVRANEMAQVIAASYGIRRVVRLIQTDSPDLLATWGLRRPCVLLPSHAREWPEDRTRIVLCHELAHVRRHDWFVQMSAEVLRTLLWFNPLAWIACTRLRRAGEEACDDVVLGRGVQPADYARHLLDLARQCRGLHARRVPAVRMAHPSTLERRIVAMLNPRLNRRALSRRAAIVTAAVLLAITLPIAALRAGQVRPTLFSGSLYDTTGGVLPGVSLTLEDAAGGTQTAVSNAEGRFQFAAVPSGKYVLAATLAGFRTFRQEFELSQRGDWDKAITLQVGTVSETISVSSPRIAVSATAPRSQAAPIRIGGNLRPPLKEVDVRPIYPESMRAAGREGVVPLDAVIGTDGSVTSVRVLSASVHPDFAIAAVDAVRQWHFTPTLLNGRPVEVVMTVKVTFSLSD